jgi:hypothetical protein
VPTLRLKAWLPPILRAWLAGSSQSDCDGFGIPPGTYACAVVRFDSGVELTVQPTSFFQGGPGGAIVRVALPLKLAWALTVHKSQGMSLTRVAGHVTYAAKRRKWAEPPPPLRVQPPRAVAGACEPTYYSLRTRKV